jgi:hypothetical protein
MPSPYQGSCQCGAVQFEFRGEPRTLYACHCTECQQRSGGALRLSMWVARAALVVLRGPSELRSHKHSSGRLKVRRVCAVCETDLWSEPPDRPNLAVLRPSTLIQYRSFEPVAHLYTRSALPWFVFPPGAKTYETVPDDWLELTKLWQDRHDKSAA